MEKNNVKIVFENNEIFYGKCDYPFKETIAEVVFNTSMVGYQEIITDASYKNQMVVMTYPIMGSYGINYEDSESKGIHLSALICKEYNDLPSNFRSEITLKTKLMEYGVPLIYNVDTRRLTRLIRDKGSMVAIICDIDEDTESCIDKIKNYEIPHNEVSLVSTKEIYDSNVENASYKIALIDFGAKLSIIKYLNEKGCNVRVFPHNVNLEEIISYNPDGIFLSNGPGDPKDNKIILENLKKLKGEIPISGICLGHQIISLLYNADTYKLKFGHRGSNHPVKNLETNKIEITSQNHSYGVTNDSIKGTDLVVTHINLIDGSIEGVKNTDDFVFSIQYHPESAAGPMDSLYLFDKFLENIKNFKEKENA